MPSPGMRWRHVILGTLNSWLPGDPRGFRTRDHKLHSSGDYKAPPPPEEHAPAARRHSENISGDPVIIPKSPREKVGTAIIKKLQSIRLRVLAIAVAGMHTHILVELPDDKKAIKSIIGRCKMKASHAIRAEMPGRVWGGGCHPKRVDTAEHQRRAYRYILRQPDAWIWSF